MSPGEPGGKLAIWTFRDDAGRHHVVLPVGRTTLGGKAYHLAVSDRTGLLVLEERAGGALAPVADEETVKRVRDAVRGTLAGAAEPAVFFEAKGPRGKKARFAATRLVAHAGKSFLYALDPAGGGPPQVFEVTLGPRKKAPALVADEALAARVRTIAESEAGAGAGARPVAEPRFGNVTLTLPSGGKRELRVVREATVDGRSYAIAADRADARRGHVLRIGPAGALEPVTDAALVERVRAAAAAAGPPAPGRVLQ